MNRAERRARKHWQGEPVDPIEVAGQRLGALADRIMDLHRTTAAAAARFEAGAATAAQLEAVARWAVGAGAAYARAAEDLARLDAQLKQAGGL